ncbi:DNA-binding protein [uncultured Microbulbifer sp.]|uniref:DNA-binding protein n=1 Tax=uncultured Microbulbifer sp. TaxID=348147 RepID=UPI002624EAE5|nr:DNA-binding protein [uncultured Microbulbifer sp.]
MARTGVTYLDIVQAAKTIKGRGEDPTVDRVREQLGTGSKSTIAPLLKRWRNESTTDTDISGLPKDLIEALKGLHQRIQGVADKRVEEVQQEFQAQEAVINAQLEEIRTTSSEQSVRLREVEQKLSVAESENRRLKQALEQTQAALEKSDYQRQEAAERILEQKTTIEEVKQENRDIRDHFEHFQQRTASDRQHERDQYRAAAEQLKDQVAALHEQQALTERRFNELELLYKQAQALIIELNREKQDLREQIGSASAEAASLKQQSEERGSALRDNLAALTGLREQISKLQSDEAASQKAMQLQQYSLERLESELITARDRLELLNDENRILTREKAMIQGQFAQLERSLKT